MGTWGYGIKENDTSFDVVETFYEKYNDGMEPKAIHQAILNDFEDSLKDIDDCDNVLLPLAQCLWEICALDDDMLAKVRERIESGGDIEVKRSLGADDDFLKKRAAALKKLLTKISVPKDKPKQRKKLPKKIQSLNEGDIFSIKLNDNTWTIAQLCNLFTLNERYSQYTLAFFNYKFESATEVLAVISTINLKNPIAIFTLNRPPLKYEQLSLVGKREISYENAPDFKKDISSSLGMYKNCSTDFESILSAFFGLLPWDCFGVDDYIDKKLIDGVEKRNDVKFMKDFSTEELKSLLSPDNFKLKQLLKHEDCSKGT